MRKRKYPVIICVYILLCGVMFNTSEAFAQRQSGRVYEFINLPSTARITALGGYAVPTLDNDLGMALFYPSLINPGLENNLSLNFVDYFGDINYGTAAFSKGFNRIGNLTLGISYINYGTFLDADEMGNTFGEFTAGEYVVSLGWGRALTEKISIGSNIKAISSTFEQYSSFGLATDIAVGYFDEERLIASSLVFRNIGRQITTYYSDREPLPFDIVFGISKKLINAPLRFSFVAHNLHNYDLTYEDPVSSGPAFSTFDTGATTSQERMSEISDKLLRHAVFGMEFTPTENFIAGIGYNYRRRQEMGVDTRLSTVGLSWGVGVRIANFMFHYGRSNYHLAGAPNHFSISTNLDRLFAGGTEVPSIR
ncbi:MAG: type IX secretion system protein PorQ [Bacteroidales bacterium]|nr:type IX secretion system protein PorQ [Bacteroidales bacterium]